MTLSITKPRFGMNISLAISDTDHHDLVTEARYAEVLGFDLITMHLDHPNAIDLHRPTASLEMWTVLSWITAQTTPIQVAPSILALSYRHPALIAKMAGTLDRLSGGCLILVLGAG